MGEIVYFEFDKKEERMKYNRLNSLKQKQIISLRVADRRIEQPQSVYGYLFELYFEQATKGLESVTIVPRTYQLAS